MRIIIPTKGRIGNQATLERFSPELQAITTLVCPKYEELGHLCNFPKVEIVVQPDDDMTISKKREWIMREWYRRGYEKIAMFDDDIKWYVRISETDWHLRRSTHEDQNRYFAMLQEKIGPEYVHGGWGSRQGNNNKEWGWEYNSRSMFCLAYFLPTVLTECELGRINTREDMDITLQLLRKGYPNAVLNSIAGQQGAWGAMGGCASERTIETSNNDARRLAEFHPGYVRLVERSYDYNSSNRIEVVCAWKKAFKDGQKRRDRRARGYEINEVF